MFGILALTHAQGEQIEGVQKQVLGVIAPEVCYPEALL